MHFKETIQEIRNSIVEKDRTMFIRHTFHLTMICRKNILEQNRGILKDIYPLLTDLLMDFYKNGDPEWEDVNEKMGGLEEIRGFVGDILETVTGDEIMNHLKSNPTDTGILNILRFRPDGMLSGNIAENLNKNKNTITNKLPGLERLGLVRRNKIGKNSNVYITPKGKDAIELIEPHKEKVTVNQLPAWTGI